MKNFWQNLPKPFFCQAPMEDVTDTVFRQMLLKTARPDVFFTEFVNVEGMFSEGAGIVNQRLKYVVQEQPLVAQVWGLNPENFYKAAQKILKLGFSGIDINMGCPQKKVIKKGACAGLIKNPKLAKEIIQVTKKGILKAMSFWSPDRNRDDRIPTELQKFTRSYRSFTIDTVHSLQDDNIFPISVKTRIGFNEIITEDWIGFLLEQDLDAIIVHGRTAKEQSKVGAHWDEIGKAVKLRNQMKAKTLIIGNGDVKDRADGLNKAKQYGVDGIMIGRGIFSNLWAFSPVSHFESQWELGEKSSEALQSHNSTMKQCNNETRLHLLSQHLKLFHQTWGNTKSFSLMKKFIKIYISGFKGALELRKKLMETGNYQEANEIISGFLE